MTPIKLSEKQLIQTYFAPLAADASGALSLQDDAALLVPEQGKEWVVTADVLFSGTHFFADDTAEDIAKKALCVNLSDLAAKGAKPKYYLLCLGLPKSQGQVDQMWFACFAEGLAAIQSRYGCHLIGGDLTQTDGPLMVSITAHGLVDEGRMVRRSTAEHGDLVYVSGTIGDSALGLMLRKNPDLSHQWGLTEQEHQELLKRYLLPTPRTSLIQCLSDYAHASADVSDGLVGDFETICAASGVGGQIYAPQVPLSTGGRKALQADPNLLATILTGGDDYEIVATVPQEFKKSFEEEAHKSSLPVTVIGEINENHNAVTVLDGKGKALELPQLAYDHFTRSE